MCLEKVNGTGIEPETSKNRTSGAQLRSSVTMMQDDVGKLGSKMNTTESTVKSLGHEVRSLNEKVLYLERAVKVEGGHQGRSRPAEDKVDNLSDRVLALEQLLRKHEQKQEGGETSFQEQAGGVKERVAALEWRLEQYQQQQEKKSEEREFESNQYCDHWAVLEPPPVLQPTILNKYVSRDNLQAHLKEIYQHIDERLSMAVKEIHTKVVDSILELQQAQPRNATTSTSLWMDQALDGPRTPPQAERFLDSVAFEVQMPEVLHPGLPRMSQPELGGAMSACSTPSDVSLRSLCFARSGIYASQAQPPPGQ